MSTPKPKRLSPPPWTPVKLGDAKRQVKVAESVHAHDQELMDLIEAGTLEAERDTSIVAATGDFAITYQAWPLQRDGSIRLPFRNVTAIVEVKTNDGETETILDPSTYVLDNGVWPLLHHNPRGQWPTVSTTYPVPITLTFTAGAASYDEVDQGLKRMVLAYIQRMFEPEDEKAEGLGKPYEALRMGRQAAYP